MKFLMTDGRPVESGLSIVPGRKHSLKLRSNGWPALWVSGGWQSARHVYESTFGLAKELHGLRRTRFRGRRWVQIQLWLTAAAMNIKRAVRNIQRKGWPAAPAELLSRFIRALSNALVSHTAPALSAP